MVNSSCCGDGVCVVGEVALCLIDCLDDSECREGKLYDSDDESGFI